MLQTRRSILHVIRQTTRRTHQRRYESSTGHASSAGNAAGSPHPPSANQSFGRGFYITLAVLPLSYAIHQYSFSDDQNPPLFTRIISTYLDYRDRWEERNNTHTAMMEVAANDRSLFLNSRPSVMRQLEFPEVFNTGSPYNVPAGHSINLAEVIAHYEKLNREVDEKRVERQRRRDAEAAEAERRLNATKDKTSTTKQGWLGELVGWGRR